jgi:hypothetical protein
VLDAFVAFRCRRDACASPRALVNAIFTKTFSHADAHASRELGRAIDASRTSPSAHAIRAGLGRDTRTGCDARSVVDVARRRRTRGVASCAELARDAVVRARRRDHDTTRANAHS